MPFHLTIEPLVDDGLTVEAYAEAVFALTQTKAPVIVHVDCGGPPTGRVLKAALEGDLFQVELRPEPSPPPLPWWRRVRGWPHRIHNWLRRVFLREKEIDQFARDLMKAYEPTDAIHAMATRESPLMALMRKPDEDPDGAESFILRGRGTRHRDDEALAREREARIDAACEKVAPWWTPPEP